MIVPMAVMVVMMVDEDIEHDDDDDDDDDDDIHVHVQVHLSGRRRKDAPKAAWPRDCKVFAWAKSSKASKGQPIEPGFTKVKNRIPGRNSLPMNVVVTWYAL